METIPVMSMNIQNSELYNLVRPRVEFHQSLPLTNRRMDAARTKQQAAKPDGQVPSQSHKDMFDIKATGLVPNVTPTWQPAWSIVYDENASLVFPNIRKSQTSRCTLGPRQMPNLMSLSFSPSTEENQPAKKSVLRRSMVSSTSPSRNPDKPKQQVPKHARSKSLTVDCPVITTDYTSFCLQTSQEEDPFFNIRGMGLGFKKVVKPSSARLKPTEEETNEGMAQTVEAPIDDDGPRQNRDWTPASERAVSSSELPVGSQQVIGHTQAQGLDYVLAQDSVCSTISSSSSSSSSKADCTSTEEDLSGNQFLPSFGIVGKFAPATSRQRQQPAAADCRQDWNRRDQGAPGELHKPQSPIGVVHCAAGSSQTPRKVTFHTTDHVTAPIQSQSAAVGGSWTNSAVRSKVRMAPTLDLGRQFYPATSAIRIAKRTAAPPTTKSGFNSYIKAGPTTRDSSAFNERNYRWK